MRNMERRWNNAEICNRILYPSFFGGHKNRKHEYSQPAGSSCTSTRHVHAGMGLDAEVMEFIDNGYSGTNFERPQVQKLIELVRANQIDCIIVKDYCAIIGLNQKDLENQGILA